jgi:hypothetical protein
MTQELHIALIGSVCCKIAVTIITTKFVVAGIAGCKLEQTPPWMDKKYWFHCNKRSICHSELDSESKLYRMLLLCNWFVKNQNLLNTCKPFKFLQYIQTIANL